MKTNLTIEIDGVKYELNVTKALASGAITPVKPIRVGNVYKKRDISTNHCDTFYLLSIVASQRPKHNPMVALVSLNKEANRWANGVAVSDKNNISHNEWVEIICGQEFEYVTDDVAKLLHVGE